jgi:hypothetical protein
LVLALLSIASYKRDVIEREIALAERRYLLVILSLLGSATAAAARDSGRCWVLTGAFG